MRTPFPSPPAVGPRRSRSAAAAAIAFALLCATGAADAARPASPTTEAPIGPTLADAVASSSRTPDYVSRDRYRHPLQTLSFFGIQPQMTVVEIWPSSGWYTEILAPYLRARGHYLAAMPAVSAADASEGRKAAVAKYRAKLASLPALYDRVEVTEFSPPKDLAIAPPGSADAVLSFRNVHNWIAGGYEKPAFAAFYTALKPGGTLGIVEHRAAPGTTLEQTKKSGYVTEEEVKQLAAAAGFRFVASSPVNDNPKDTKDYPDGVWTLPPTLQLGDKDRDRYLAIGESDRMTLKFVKPR